MTGDVQLKFPDEYHSPDPHGESTLLEAEKLPEASADDLRLDSSPDPGISSPSFSHWSQSWSKPAEISTNAPEPQFSLLPDEPAQEAAQVVDEVLPSTSLSESCNRAIIGAGLVNLGNTCFLNSVLQCFIHTIPLLQPILSNWNLAHSSDNCDKERFCLLCALRDLIQRSLVLNTTVSPWDLVNNLTHISSNFRRFQQEDAHEFLQCFLDRLESCHKPQSKDCTSLQSDNIVQQAFGGRLVSNLKCCNCDHSSDTFEPFIDLSLEIDDADNLYTALHSFTKVEKIEDPETKFTCEKCNERVFVEKKLSFDQAPSVAVLHLKRFKNDGSSVEKIDKHVAFPLDLDLVPFTSGGEHNYAAHQYVLYAVVVHIGLTPTSGHYYCFVRLSSDMWCKYDDSQVELVHEDYVLSQEAYVLFYVRESTPWFSSFIETQKEFVNSTLWNTSPKSVLDTSLVSPTPSSENKFGCNSNEVSSDTRPEHEGGNNNETKDSSVQNETKRKARVRDLLASAAPCSKDSSNMSLPKVLVSPNILPEKFIHKPDVSVPQNRQIDIEAAFRSPSPEIYREDSPDAGFTIHRSHLRSSERIRCKRKLVEDTNDEVKQARSFARKNMPSARAEQLMAAMRGSRSEPSMNRKKTRRFVVK